MIKNKEVIDYNKKFFLDDLNLEEQEKIEKLWLQLKDRGIDLNEFVVGISENQDYFNGDSWRVSMNRKKLEISIKFKFKLEYFKIHAQKLRKIIRKMLTKISDKL